MTSFLKQYKRLWVFLTMELMFCFHDRLLSMVMSKYLYVSTFSTNSYLIIVSLYEGFLFLKSSSSSKGISLWSNAVTIALWFFFRMLRDKCPFCRLRQWRWEREEDWLQHQDLRQPRAGEGGGQTPPATNGGSRQVSAWIDFFDKILGKKKSRLCFLWHWSLQCIEHWLKEVINTSRTLDWVPCSSLMCLHQNEGPLSMRFPWTL